MSQSGHPYTILDSMVPKIRSLIEDFGEKDFQIFKYGHSNIFTLREPNIDQLTQVLINGEALQSGQGIVFDTNTNKITFTGVTFTIGDTIEVDYCYTQYSRKRIVEYVRGALTWLSIFDYSTDTYEIYGDCNEEDISPDLSDPSNKTADLICIITSILILPEYNHYRMPNLAINYPEKECREDKIRNIIERYKQGVGIVDIIEWNRSPGL